MTDAKLRYKKILLKMSGEVLMGDALFGIDTKTIEAVAEDIKEVVDAGLELWAPEEAHGVSGVQHPAGSQRVEGRPRRPGRRTGSQDGGCCEQHRCG